MPPRSHKNPLLAALTAIAVFAWALNAVAAERFITLASTTSTDNSGLFGEILPKFTAATGISVRVVAVGTGAALRLGRRGDVDVVLVHSRGDELRFVADGHGVAAGGALRGTAVGGLFRAAVGGLLLGVAHLLFGGLVAALGLFLTGTARRGGLLLLVSRNSFNSFSKSCSR